MVSEAAHTVSEAAAQQQLAAYFNWKWANGRPSSHIYEAGLLVHVFDLGYTPRNLQQLRQWRQDCTAKNLWAVLRNGKEHSAPQWSINLQGWLSGGHLLRHRLSAPRPFISASLINRAHNHTWIFGTNLDLKHAPILHALEPYNFMPMVVLDGEALQLENRLSCCYASDGRSNAKISAKVPGCSDHKEDLGESKPDVAMYRLDGPNNELAACMREMLAEQRELDVTRPGTHYNEVVVNATGGFGSGITLAIFVDVRASSEAVNLARGIQAEAKASGISLPLLEYDATKMSPFSVLEG